MFDKGQRSIAIPTVFTKELLAPRRAVSLYIHREVKASGADGQRESQGVVIWESS